MIAYETCERRLENGAELEVKTLGSLTQFILIMPSHTAHERDGQVRTVVGLDVVTQEIDKVINHDSSDTSVIKVTADKIGEGSQEAVSQRLTIDALDDFWQIQTHLLLKDSFNFFRQFSTIQVVDKALSKNGSTALVTQNIAQGWGMLDNAVSIKCRNIS